MSWEAAFAAVSALLGEEAGDVEASLRGPGGARAAAWARGLREASRDERARAIAGAVARVAVEVETARLA